VVKRAGEGHERCLQRRKVHKIELREPGGNLEGRGRLEAPSDWVPERSARNLYQQTLRTARDETCPPRPKKRRREKAYRTTPADQTPLSYSASGQVWETNTREVRSPPSGAGVASKNGRGRCEGGVKEWYSEEGSRTGDSTLSLITKTGKNGLGPSKPKESRRNKDRKGERGTVFRCPSHGPDNKKGSWKGDFPRKTQGVRTARPEKRRAQRLTRRKGHELQRRGVSASVSEGARVTNHAYLRRGDKQERASYRSSNFGAFRGE